MSELDQLIRARNPRTKGQQWQQKISDALMYLGGGTPAVPEEDDTLQQIRLMQQIQTGSPEFKREQAQTTANQDLSYDLLKARLERQEIREEEEDLRKETEERVKKVHAEEAARNQQPAQPTQMPVQEQQPIPRQLTEEEMMMRPNDLPTRDANVRPMAANAPTAIAQNREQLATSQPGSVLQATEVLPQQTGQAVPSFVQPTQTGANNDFRMVPDKAAGREYDESIEAYRDIPATFKFEEDPNVVMERMSRGATLDKARVLAVGQFISSDVGFNKTADLLRNLVSAHKAKREDQGGETGLWPGLWGRVRDKFKDPKAAGIAAFPGQRDETALAMNQIITGSTRVIKSIVKMIMETIPEDTDPDSFVANKIAQSLYNAYGLRSAVETTLGDLFGTEDGDIIVEEMFRDKTPDEIKQMAVPLSNDEKAALIPLIQDILNSSPNPEFSLDSAGPRFREGDPRASQSPQGQQVGRFFVEEE